jgi:tRNA pseudouridine13 synthase
MTQAQCATAYRPVIAPMSDSLPDAADLPTDAAPAAKLDAAAPAELPFAHGGPPLRARLRATPEDFRVDERLGFGADGEGEHVLLTVRKRGANTDWVARELARFAGADVDAVGYAGLKDRHAVTTQAFTVPIGNRAEPDWSSFPHAEVQITALGRIRRKIKRGALEANQFTLVLRECSGDRDRVEAVLAAIAARGVPNYFGEQRFGLGGANVARAEAMFAGKRVDRNTRSMLLSAARSQMFNAVLAQRVAMLRWDAPMDGEVWCLSGSRSWFGPEALSDALLRRLHEGDIHPSGMLWGRGPLRSAGAVAALEQSVANAHATLTRGLESAGLDQDRRALRLMPQGLRWQWLDDASLELSFELPPGAYATVVVRELAQTDGG